MLLVERSLLHRSYWCLAKKLLLHSYLERHWLLNSTGYNLFHQHSHFVLGHWWLMTSYYQYYSWDQTNSRCCHMDNCLPLNLLCCLYSLQCSERNCLRIHAAWCCIWRTYLAIRAIDDHATVISWWTNIDFIVCISRSLRIADVYAGTVNGCVAARANRIDIGIRKSKNRTSGTVNACNIALCGSADCQHFTTVYGFDTICK